MVSNVPKTGGCGYGVCFQARQSHMITYIADVDKNDYIGNPMYNTVNLAEPLLFSQRVLSN